jgi:hypothetical protein
LPHSSAHCVRFAVLFYIAVEAAQNRQGAKRRRTLRFGGEALQRAFGASPLTAFASLSCFALRLKPRKTGNTARRKKGKPKL